MIDLGQSHEGLVSHLVDCGQEAEPQIVLGDVGEKFRKCGFIAGQDRTHMDAKPGSGDEIRAPVILPSLRRMC